MQSVIARVYDRERVSNVGIVTLFSIIIILLVIAVYILKSVLKSICVEFGPGSYVVNYGFIYAFCG